MMRLTLLGSFELRAADGTVIALPTDKARALCTYLALEAPRPHRRETLAALLWPDILHESALTNLRQTLYRLRLALEQGQPGVAGELLSVDRQTVEPHLQHWWVDALGFTGLLDECERHTHTELANCDDCLDRMAQAVSLYHGELLEGLSLPDAPAFEEWQLFQRGRLHHQVVQARMRLAAACEGRGDYTSALQHAGFLLALEPYHEATHRQMMRLLAHNGQTSQALAHYDSCRRLLRDELGAAPEAQTTELYHQIKAGALGTAITASTPVLLHSRQTAMPLPPFVARGPELARLNAAAAQVIAGRGQIRFVAGEAGSGKTAISRAFAQQVRADHPQFVIVRSLCSAQTGIGDPYLPFRELLNQLAGTAVTAGEEWLAQGDANDRMLPLLATALVERGADLLESFVSSAALLARAEGEASKQAAKNDAWLLRLRARVAQSQQAEGAAIAQSHIFAQYTAVLQQVAIHQPLLLILDDLQWADASSLGLLFHLMRSIEQSRILVLGAYRPEEMAQGTNDTAHPLTLLVSEAKRSFGDVVVDLDNAGERTGPSFVDALLDSEPNCIGGGFRQALYAHTKGHPLFTVELLRDLEARGTLQRDAEGRWAEPAALDWGALPARVEGVIEARIGRLPPALRELLQAASVEGEEFTAEVIAQVEMQSAREVIRLLSAELDRRHRLVSAQGVASGGGQTLTRYRFRHSLFQNYVYTSLDVAERGYLHAATADALEALYAGERELVAVQLARHYEATGRQEEAVDALLLAGERAAALSAETEAIVHFKRALQLTGTWPDSSKRKQRELALQIALGNALTRVRGYSSEETGAAFGRARVLCRQLGETDHLFTILVGLEGYHGARGEFDRALALAEELIDLAEQRQDPLIAVEGHYAMADTLFYQGAFARTLAHMEQAIAAYDPQQHALYVRLGSEDPGVMSMMVAACTLWNLGYPEQARRRVTAGLALAEELGHPYTLMLAQFWTAVTLMGMRDYTTVRSHAAAARQLCHKYDFHYFLGLATFIEGWALAMQGAEAAAIPQMEQSLAQMGDIGANRPRHSYLAFLAEAYGRIGDFNQALRLVDEGLAAILPGGGASEEALYRLRGEFLMEQAAAAADGPAADEILAQSEATLRRALAIAQEQDAKSLELRACMGLSRLWLRQGKVAAAEQLLGDMYNWFTEGLDTPDMQEAQQLLGMLRNAKNE